jgi:hypothetical protein
VIAAKIAEVRFAVEWLGAICPESDCAFHVGPPLFGIQFEEVANRISIEFGERKISLVLLSLEH